MGEPSFVHFLVKYIWIALLALLVFNVILRYARARWDLANTGAFALAACPKYVRDIMTFLVYCFAIVPLLIFLIGAVFGLLLAAAEGWPIITGVEYVLSNITGLTTPLTEVTPESLAGEIVDVVVSMWALLLATMVMGIAASMALITTKAERIAQHSVFTVVVYIFIFLPFTLCIVCSSGAILALIEGWTFRDGFLFMASILCGLATPLTEVEPETETGKFVEVFYASFELAVGGAIIGLVSEHPVVLRMIQFMEGVSAEEMALDEDEAEHKAQGAKDSLGYTALRWCPKLHGDCADNDSTEESESSSNCDSARLPESTVSNKDPMLQDVIRAQEEVCRLQNLLSEAVGRLSLAQARVANVAATAVQ